MLKLELSALYGNTEGMVQILLLNVYKYSREYSRRGLTNGIDISFGDTKQYK